jgi:hypothetical protein
VKIVLEANVPPHVEQQGPSTHDLGSTMGTPLTNERPRDHHKWSITRRCLEAPAFRAVQAIRFVLRTKQKLGLIGVLRHRGKDCTDIFPVSTSRSRDAEFDARHAAENFLQNRIISRSCRHTGIRKIDAEFFPRSHCFGKKVQVAGRHDGIPPDRFSTNEWSLKRPGNRQNTRL